MANAQLPAHSELCPGQQKGWHSSHQCQWPVPVSHSADSQLQLGVPHPEQLFVHLQASGFPSKGGQRGNLFSSYLGGMVCKSFSCYIPGIQPWVNSSLCLSAEYVPLPPTLVLATCQLWSRAQWLAPWTQTSWINIPPGALLRSRYFQGRALMKGSLTTSCLQFIRWQSVWRRWDSLWWRPGGPWRAMETKFSVWTGAKTREELWALPRYAVGQVFFKDSVEHYINLLAVLCATLSRWYLGLL